MVRPCSRPLRGLRASLSQGAEKSSASEAVDSLRQQAQKSDTVLLTATKNLATSHAIILNEVLLDL